MYNGPAYDFANAHIIRLGYYIKIIKIFGRYSYACEFCIFSSFSIVTHFFLNSLKKNLTWNVLLCYNEFSHKPKYNKIWQFQVLDLLILYHNSSCVSIAFLKKSRHVSLTRKQRVLCSQCREYTREGWQLLNRQKAPTVNGKTVFHLKFRWVVAFVVYTSYIGKADIKRLVWSALCRRAWLRCQKELTSVQGVSLSSKLPPLPIKKPNCQGCVSTCETLESWSFLAL